MKKDKINNIFMLIMFFCLLAYGMLALIRTPKEISYTENRNLNKFQQFTAKGFIDGTYQTGLENAFTDQFIGGGRIKDFMNKNLNLSKAVMDSEWLCGNQYLSIGGGYYTYDCQNMIVDYPYANITDEKYFKRIGSEYSKLHDKANFYYYYIPTTANFDLRKNEMVVDVPNLIKSNWTGNYTIKSLEIKDSETINDYFYKTDHHWNYKGAYEGYKDIIKMLNPSANILKPIEEKKFNTIFYGSRARVTSFYEYAEEFKVYRFEFPKFEVFVNGEKSSYGNEEEYYKGIYSKNDTTNHYGTYYGGDYPEIVFINPNKKQKNILVLGNSFTNAINKMIATEYDETYIVDLRHYEGHFGKKFNIESYIKENDIDDVLVVMEWWYINGAEFDMWGDK